MKSMSLLSGLALALAAVSTAEAQVTLDVSKITCQQFVTYKITNPDNVALWLSGYYHGKRSDPVVDTQAMLANAQKLKSYCIRNPETLVMQAIETDLSSR
jgi:acid stress chaperone HdeB